METYNKLVRSKILQILTDKGMPHTAHLAPPEEYKEKLYEKLLEEAGELAQDRNKEELADVLEVIEAIIILNRWSRKEIEMIRLKKRDEKGSFLAPIILEQS